MLRLKTLAMNARNIDCVSGVNSCLIVECALLAFAPGLRVVITTQMMVGSPGSGGGH